MLRAVVIAASLLASLPALAQTSPGLVYGQVPTPAQWNSYFSGKQDYLGAAPCLVTGCTMSGELITAAPTTSGAGFNLPPGTAPTSPNNGDLWTTSSGLFTQVDGSTIELTGAGSGSFTATAPLAVTFPSAGVVNYALINGTSVANPGTGTPEMLLPMQTVAGASKTFATADFFKKTRRSNSGSAMSDTFPASTATGLINGTRIDVANIDASATDTITAGGGTTINGNSTYAIPPGRDIWFAYNSSLTEWLLDANTGSALLSANNLSDVASASTALNNLFSTVAANKVWAGPASGSAANPTMRALVGADLPVPSASTLGGIESITSAANEWIAYIDTSGAPHQSQPALGNLSGWGVNVLSAAEAALNGSGGLVGYNGNLGTPTAGVLTNATGLPLSTGIIGFGTNVEAALAAALNSSTGVISPNGLSSGTCSNVIAINSSNAPILASCPGASSSIQVGATSITSASGSNELLTTGTVSGGTGTLANVSIGTGLSLSAGTLSNSGVTSAQIATAGGLTNTGTCTITTTGTCTIYSPGGAQNVLRNNSLTSWFHGTTITITTAGGWCAEGIYVIPTGASVTCERSTLQINNGPYYAVEIVGASGVTDVKVRYVVESLTANKIASEITTFQLLYGNETGSSVTPTLATKYATGGQDNWGSSTTDLSATNLQACANGTNCTEAYTLNVSGNGDNGYEFVVDFGALGSGATIYIDEFDARATPGVATGLNSNPPPMEILNAATDVAWNERFFQSSYDNGTAPSTSTTNGLTACATELYVSSSWYGVAMNIPLRSKMRADPTFNYWDTVGNPNKMSGWENSTQTNNLSVGSDYTFNAGQSAISVIPTGAFSPSGAAPPWMCQWTADATISGG